jgi:hypothetical protein
MKSKSIYLYCGGASSIFYIITVLLQFGMIVFWGLLFLATLSLLIKERREIKMFLIKHKNSTYLLFALTVCVATSLIISSSQIFNDVGEIIYPIIPSLDLIIFLVFYGEILISGVLKKDLKIIAVSSVLVVVLLFCLFISFSKIYGNKDEVATWIRLRDCEKIMKCSIQSWDCLCSQYVPPISLGCGGSPELY